MALSIKIPNPTRKSKFRRNYVSAEVITLLWMKRKIKERILKWYYKKIEEKGKKNNIYKGEQEI